MGLVREGLQARFKVCQLSTPLSRLGECEVYFSKSMKDLVGVLFYLSTQGVASKWFLKSAINRGQHFPGPTILL